MSQAEEVPTSEYRDGEPLVRVKQLCKYFISEQGFIHKTTSTVRAVENVSFDIFRGETLGLVGESGCGKSTLGRTILQLYQPTSGTIHFKDQELTRLSQRSLRTIRQDMQIIFQDPFASLNPRMTVAQIIGEALQLHGVGQSDREAQTKDLLSMVGLRPEALYRYPHEFSGGQRQRIGIARALAVKPQFLVCDEPISALDVSIQAQVVNLLQDLQEQLNLTYLFIAHDLTVVRHIATRVAVMYLGSIVEIAPAEILYKDPKHPYTQALLSAVPVPDPEHQKEQIELKGELPSPLDPPSGCAFHPRCQYAQKECAEDRPELVTIGKGHRVSCHLVSGEAP